MVQKIILSPKAVSSFNEAVKYLRDNFSDVEIQAFTNRIDEKVLVIKSNPRLGRSINKRPNTYKTTINKRIMLYYQYKPVKKEILLLVFWNTLQNPKKLKV